jgi:hypothetical protein
MTTKHFSVQTDGYQREAVLWLINIEMGFKEHKKSHNLLHAYINKHKDRVKTWIRIKADISGMTAN